MYRTVWRRKVSNRRVKATENPRGIAKRLYHLLIFCRRKSTPKTTVTSFAYVNLATTVPIVSANSSARAISCLAVRFCSEYARIFQPTDAAPCSLWDQLLPTRQQSRRQRITWFLSSFFTLRFAYIVLPWHRGFRRGWYNARNVIRKFIIVDKPARIFFLIHIYTRKFRS